MHNECNCNDYAKHFYVLLNIGGRMKKKLTSQKGYTGIDVAIAIAILIIFTAVISTIFLNIYLQHADAQRNATATSYLTTIAELIDRTYYQDINFDDTGSYSNIVNRVASLFNSTATVDVERIAATADEDEKMVFTGSNGYTITLSINQFSPEGSGGTGQDLVKTVKVKVSYKSGSMTKNVKIEKIKSREMLITPNKPVIGKNMVAVKYVITDEIAGTGYWQITSKEDSVWYSYENKNWAKAMLLDDLVVEGGIIVNEENKDNLVGKKVISEGEIFEWIPKFAYNSTTGELLFAYSTTDNYVKHEDIYGTLAAMPADYNRTEMNSAFQAGTGFWVAKSDYSIVNSVVTESGLTQITAAQKQAATRLSTSKYGSNQSEYATISDNRYAK